MFYIIQTCQTHYMATQHVPFPIGLAKTSLVSCHPTYPIWGVTKTLKTSSCRRFVVPSATINA